MPENKKVPPSGTSQTQVWYHTANPCQITHILYGAGRMNVIFNTKLKLICMFSQRRLYFEK